MNITTPLSAAAITSSTSGWSTPESRITEPTRIIPQTVTK